MPPPPDPLPTRPAGGSPGAAIAADPPGLAPDDGWIQLVVDSGDPARTESLLIDLAGDLLAELDPARPRGGLAACWFVRKGPHLRLRLLPADGADGADGADHTEDVIGAGDDTTSRLVTTLRRRGGVTPYTTVYEPETVAFGGRRAMVLAHELFGADTRHLLQHLARHQRHPLRRELAVLLAVRLMRAAGLDWEEQGDVWTRVAAHRRDPGAIAPALVRSVRRLLTSTDDTAQSPLAADPAWSADLCRSAVALRDLAAAGELGRGHRAVLTKHLLFLFNRHGVHHSEQAALAHAAARAIFDEEPSMSRPPAPPTTQTDEPNWQALRDGLADAVARRGGFRTAAVEAAFRTVPRHHFLPGVSLDDAYTARPVVTQRAADGTSLSSASSPTLVAEMLELAEIRPGQRILEIGAATGFNAALMAELAGEDGRVVTIELDPGLAEGARANLATTPYAGRVEVRTGDGAAGAPGRVFDRIVVTAGAADIPAPWWDQLTIGGRLVVPLQLHGCGLTRALRLDRHSADVMVSTEALVCGFVPMRSLDQPDSEAVPGAGIATRVGPDVVIEHATADTGHTDGIAAALAHGERWHRWLGLDFPHAKGPAGHLDLWLATQTPGPFARLRVTRAARDNSVADPAPRWSGACLIDGGTLAYVTSRDRDNDTAELGVTAVGDRAAQLGDTLAAAVTHWRDTASQTEPTVSIRRATGSAHTQVITVRW